MQSPIPVGSAFHWNPYSPKHFTVVTPSPSESPSASKSPSEKSPAEQSLNLEDDEHDLAWATIAALRREPTDAQLLAAVQRQPHRTLLMIANALQGAPLLMTELCEKERGNVVSQVMQVIGGKHCEAVVAFLLSNAMHMATHQSGCIAFTRIFEAGTPAQREVLATFAVAHFAELAVHQYGNYVVQAVLRAGQPTAVAAATAFLMQPTLLDTLVASKFGSHVVEAFLKVASAAAVVDVCHVLLRDVDTVRAMAFSKTSNYVLQAALRQLLAVTDSRATPLTQWCLAIVPLIVAGSQFAPNINRALGYQSTTARPAA